MSRNVAMSLASLFLLYGALGSAGLHAFAFSVPAVRGCRGVHSSCCCSFVDFQMCEAEPASRLPKLAAGLECAICKLYSRVTLAKQYSSFPKAQEIVVLIAVVAFRCQTVGYRSCSLPRGPPALLVISRYDN